MLLSLWAPSRLSLSLINSRPPQSNRCYSSNPSKFISSVEKTKKTVRPEPRPFTTVPHTDSLTEEGHCKYEHGKQGPICTSSAAPPRRKHNPVIVKSSDFAGEALPKKVTSEYARCTLSFLVDFKAFCTICCSLYLHCIVLLTAIPPRDCPGISPRSHSYS